MLDNGTSVVLCNGAALPLSFASEIDEADLVLGYDISHTDSPNVHIELTRFVRDVLYLPDRILDLLEIAAYLFAADRRLYRGKRDAVEYHRWSRKVHFIIKVRDIGFWNQSSVKKLLNDALVFTSGDLSYDFTFEGGHATPTTSLFDNPNVVIDHGGENHVLLFSGGIDSLAGAIHQLKNTTSRISLISHQSGQPGTIRTQNQLFQSLAAHFPNRVTHFKFRCGLANLWSRDESQRTRAFVYTAVAFALAVALKEDKVFLFENGITSINFPRRQDLINARASRTTHPKTIFLLERLYEAILEKPFQIIHPFMFHTKSDILSLIIQYGMKDLLPSSVSCSKTFNTRRHTTHCGVCSQCVDRRFAVFATGLEKIDNPGLYAFDFINDQINEPEMKTTIIDYIRQARDFTQLNDDRFYFEMMDDLIPIIEAYPECNESELVAKFAGLCRRHGDQVLSAIKRMQQIYENPFDIVLEGSFQRMISEREYLKEPTERLVEQICSKLALAIPLTFQKNPPKDENDFNDKVHGLIKADQDRYEREFPVVTFALSRVVPDHRLAEYDLIIESKYLRGHTTPSKASEGIAADLTKYPQNSYKLFVVYDPGRAIADDEGYRKDFEYRRRCKVFIVR